MLDLPTASDHWKRLRVRRGTRRPPPVFRHVLHLAPFRLRQDVQRMHVRLARRVWPPSIPQRPRPHASAFRVQYRVPLRTTRVGVRVTICIRVDRPPHSPCALQDRRHPAQLEHAPDQAACTVPKRARSEQRARAVRHVRRAYGGARRGQHALYGREWDRVCEAARGGVGVGSGDGGGRYSGC